MPPHPNSRFIVLARCMHTICECVCLFVSVSASGPDLSKKKLLLYDCSGRVCGEVKTLRAHPVWDSPCPVVVPLTPKHTHTPMHVHTSDNHPICANSMPACTLNTCRRQNRCTPVTHSMRTPTQAEEQVTIKYRFSS